MPQKALQVRALVPAMDGGTMNRHTLPLAAVPGEIGQETTRQPGVWLNHSGDNEYASADDTTRRLLGAPANMLVDMCTVETK